MPKHTMEAPSATAETAHSPLANDNGVAPPDDLSQIVAEVAAIVPPLWPLKDYVAVNPFLGLAGHTFLDARRTLAEVRDCDLLPSREYFRQLVERGEIVPADVEHAYQQCVEEYPDLYAALDPATIINGVSEPEPDSAARERRYFTVSEVVDQRLGSAWTSHIVNDITRHFSAHYDEGEASWPSPWRDSSLYDAWRAASGLSHRMDMLGIRGFRDLVAGLPESATAAVAQCLAELGIPSSQWRPFLLGQLLSVAGWASFVQYRAREAELAGGLNDDLAGLLAIRLAYDVALARVQGVSGALETCPPPEASQGEEDQQTPDPLRDVLVRYALQVAAETAYRRQLCDALAANAAPRATAGRKTLQMVFCIDVRSEVFRRHLESVSDAAETFGFAGFFGMALEYVPLGESAGPAHCPVLLTPAFRVREGLLGAEEQTQHNTVLRRRLVRAGRKIWKSFQTSAVSCFSFVESLGLLYFGKLLTDSLQLTRPVASAECDGAPRRGDARFGPDLHACEDDQLPETKKIELAENMLRNLGLTTGFARIVSLCGHAAEVVNNPYQAGLDCGACGGHSGQPNARVAAALLNDPQVRSGLADRGIRIPDDTWFVPAVHNTTTDEIRFFDTQSMPATHAADFDEVQAWTRQAGARTRLERAGRLGKSTEADVFRRSRDWSEVRPEWGLAGNAAFVVAPRSRTAGLNLEGRAFLHSYDHRNDPDRAVLELIMTAPMIVTNWINLQYYASAVDNRAFGSGSKTLHNVVGRMGVLQGNGGDLTTGLPWQSVHDGERYQHPPLRLTVVIEAPRGAVQEIIAKHAMVHDLVSHGWMSLVVLDGEQFYRWNAFGVWQEEPREEIFSAPRQDAVARRADTPSRFASPLVCEAVPL